MNVTLTTSDEVTVAGIVVTLITSAWAVYERKQSATAKQETRRFRHLLLQQQMAQQFAEGPNRALMVFRHLRAKKWDDAAEIALLLSADIAGLNGARKLIGAPIEEHLNTALEVLGDLNRCIPGADESISSDLEARIVDGSNVLVVTINTLERSLRIKAALGGDEDGD